MAEWNGLVLFPVNDEYWTINESKEINIRKKILRNGFFNFVGLGSKARNEGSM
jgi:hypothetical protein